ncbi:acyl-CoA synthetase long-chain [Capsaspora owczarzaki ATCC 30864]|nr:acyl-CoA synthetase long-chain [Capsaspora owczarzaki ATCC 30864]|eukprot:XP_004365642.2 acyl-CoA synthetase long-chain [Capsaspora owczarzaki ATCC 30864]
MDVNAYTVGAATLAAFGVYIATRPGPKPVHQPIDVHCQTVEVDAKEHIRRNASSPGKLLSYHDYHIKTLYEGFHHGIKQAGDSNCLGTRTGNGPFVWESYNQVGQRLTNFGSGLVHHGAKAQSYIGIYSQNRAEWVIAEQACNAYSLITVPLYDTLGAETAEFIVDQAQIRTIICDPPKLALLLDSAPRMKTLKEIVKMGSVSDKERADFKAVGVALLSFAEIEAEGAAKPVPHRPPSPEDVATICYTSGTTGNPKGAMLTHGNFVTDFRCLDRFLALNKDDVYLSYLPLAHMFERIVQSGLWPAGAQIGFFRGDVKLLVEDIAALRPTIFCSVPRLLNRIYDKVVGTVTQAGGVKKFLFDQALASKSAELAQGICRRDSIWDKLVFKKVQATLGGRVRVVATGAAPIGGNVLTFLRAALGCPVFEGYGQTESSAASTTTVPGDFSVGHVGAPLPCNEIKLADVPDMNYFSKDNRGEICFRGANVFRGYLNDKAKTDEALDSEGWLHSGDIGEWDAERPGCASLIARSISFKLGPGRVHCSRED